MPVPAFSYLLKSISTGYLALAIIVGVFVGASPANVNAQLTGHYIHNEKPVSDRFIVTLRAKKPAPVNAETLTKMASGILPPGTKIVHSFPSIFAVSVLMPRVSAALLIHDVRVESVEEVGEIKAFSTQYVTADGLQGIDRIDQRDFPLDKKFSHRSFGIGVNAYVIDSGITPGHADVLSRAKVAVDFVDDKQYGIDCDGHGTHVAGIIGSKYFGVAKKVNLWGVRVLNCNGVGLNDDIIAGIDWVTTHHVSPSVANLSLGGPASQGSAIDAAVEALIKSGVTVVVAAGNLARDVQETSPARVPDAITVGASDPETDNEASFSNFGRGIDLFAPGINILSDWDGGANTSHLDSGTSMAAPMVTGAAAMYLQTHIHATPAEVTSAIIKSATANRLHLHSPNTVNRLLYIGDFDMYHAAVPMDFDGDGVADDLTVTPSGQWYMKLSSGADPATVNIPTGWKWDNLPKTCFLRTICFDWWSWRMNGLGTRYLLATGDYDGDRKADRAIVDLDTHRWYIIPSSGVDPATLGIPWGWEWGGMDSDHTLALGDYDGDGKTDRALVDHNLGNWFIIPSSGVDPATLGIPWGWHWEGMTSDHHLALGDFDGDGKTDRAIVDHNLGNWFVIPSSGVDPATLGIPWGWHWGGMNSNHEPAIGDYDGDGKADRAIVDVSHMQDTSTTRGVSRWYVVPSRGGAMKQWGATLYPVKGGKVTIPPISDYDGDGLADAVLWTPQRTYGSLPSIAYKDLF